MPNFSTVTPGESSTTLCLSLSPSVPIVLRCLKRGNFSNRWVYKEASEAPLVPRLNRSGPLTIRIQTSGVLFNRCRSHFRKVSFLEHLNLYYGFGIVTIASMFWYLFKVFEFHGRYTRIALQLCNPSSPETIWPGKTLASFEISPSYRSLTLHMEILELGRKSLTHNSRIFIRQFSKPHWNLVMICSVLKRPVNLKQQKHLLYFSGTSNTESPLTASSRSLISNLTG